MRQSSSRNFDLRYPSHIFPNKNEIPKPKLSSHANDSLIGLERDKQTLRVKADHLGYDPKWLKESRSAQSTEKDVEIYRLRQVNQNLEKIVDGLKESRSAQSTEKDVEIYRLRQVNQNLEKNVADFLLTSAAEKKEMAKRIDFLEKHVDGTDEVMSGVLQKNLTLTQECKISNDNFEHMKDRYKRDIRTIKDEKRKTIEELEQKNSELKLEIEAIHLQSSRSDNAELRSFAEKNEELNIKLNKLGDKYRELEEAHENTNNHYEELFQEYNNLKRSSDVTDKAKKEEEIHIKTMELRNHISELEEEIKRRQEGDKTNLINFERKERKLHDEKDWYKREVIEQCNNYEDKVHKLENTLEESRKMNCALNEKITMLLQGELEPISVSRNLCTSSNIHYNQYETNFNSVTGISSPQVTYDTLKDDRAELADSDRRLSEANKKAKDTKEENDCLKNKLEDLANEYNDKAKKTEQIIEEKNGEIFDLERKLKFLQEQEGEYKTKIASLGENVHGLKLEIDRCHSPIIKNRKDNSGEQMGACLLEIGHLKDTIIKLEKEKKDLIKMYKKEEKEARSPLYSRSAGERMLSSIPSKFTPNQSDLLQENMDLRAEYDKLKDLLESKAEELDKKQKAINNMKDKIKTQNNEFNVNTFTQLKHQNAAYSKDLIEKADELDRLKATVKQLSDNMAQMQKDKNNLDAEMKNLKLLNFGKEAVARQNVAVEQAVAGNQDTELLKRIPAWWLEHMANRPT